MRRLLLASAAAVLLALPARADMPVIDIGQIAQSIQMVQNGLQVLNTVQQQLNTAKQTLASLQQTTNINSIVPQLGALRSPLGTSIPNLSGTLSGFNPGAALSSAVQSVLNRNTVYQNPANTWYAQEQTRHRQAIAGQQAAAEQLMANAEERKNSLQQLQDRLGTAADPAEKLDLIARANLETAQIQNLQVQANAVQTFASSENANFTQRRDEQAQQELDTLVNQLQSDRATRFSGN